MHPQSLYKLLKKMEGSVKTLIMKEKKLCELSVFVPRYFLRLISSNFFLGAILCRLGHYFW